MMEQKEQEFTRLVEKHKTVVYTVCYMFSGSREEAEDLFQDVLVRLWKGYDTFRGESDVRTWIYRVSLNTCINGQKRKKKESTQGLRRHHRPAEREAMTEPSVGRRRIGQEGNEAVSLLLFQHTEGQPVPGVKAARRGGNGGRTEGCHAFFARKYGGYGIFTHL